MSAPGRKPFDSLDLPPTAQLPNGDGDLSIGAVHEERRGKFAHGQPAQVPQTKANPGVIFEKTCI